MEYIIRKIESTEYPVLEDFLYEAIFVPDGVEAPPRSVLKLPELQIYFADFGKEDDHALVAECDGRIIGAAWARIMHDYGHVDDETPSLSISLYKEYRNMGVGTDQFTQLLALLKQIGYRKVSLSVQKENYAVNMYLRTGFQVVDENEEDYIMVKAL